MTSTTPPPSQSAIKCLNCGSELEHPRINELESQVEALNDKASSAVHKLADYEEELRRLRANSTISSSSSSNSLSPTFPPHHPHHVPERAPSPATRISSFLFPSTALRRSGGPPSPPPDSSPAELAKERDLRLKAEERLQQVTSELEDLSASLFQSANEMVAEERRARSKLEERVVVLEQRDMEKRERLGVLERAVDRISRVREMLSGGVN